MFVREDLLEPITSLVVCGFGEVESTSTSDTQCELHFSLQTSLTCEPFGPEKIWECCQDADGFDRINHKNFPSVVEDLFGSTPDGRSGNSGRVVTDNHIPMVRELQAAMVASSGGASAREQPTTCPIGPVLSVEETPLNKIDESRNRRRKQARRSRARPHLPTRKAGLFHLRSRLNARDGQLTTVQAKRSRDADREDADEEADSDGEGGTHLPKRLKFAGSEREVPAAPRSDGRTALSVPRHASAARASARRASARTARCARRCAQRALAGRGARAGAPRRTPLPTRRW